MHVVTIVLSIVSGTIEHWKIIEKCGDFSQKRYYSNHHNIINITKPFKKSLISLVS